MVVMVTFQHCDECNLKAAVPIFIVTEGNGGLQTFSVFVQGICLQRLKEARQENELFFTLYTINTQIL